MKTVYILVILLKSGHGGYGVNLQEYSSKKVCEQQIEMTLKQFNFNGFLKEEKGFCIEVKKEL